MTQARFCQQCGQCRTDCPYGVEIPALMRSHMYAVQYANLDMARSTLACLGAGRGLASCASCGACKGVCRNDVNIGANISRLVSSRQPLGVQQPPRCAGGVLPPLRHAVAAGRVVEHDHPIVSLRRLLGAPRRTPAASSSSTSVTPPGEEGA